MRVCEGCGHANSGDAMFCSKCGARLSEKKAPVVAPPEPAELAPPAPPVEIAPPLEIAPPVELVPPVDLAPPVDLVPPPEMDEPAQDVEPVESAPPSEPPPGTKPRARRVAGAARTMLGIPMETPEPAKKEAPVAPAIEKHDSAPPPGGKTPSKRIPGSARTMLGMPAPDKDEIAAAVKQAREEVARSAPPEGAAPEASPSKRPRASVGPSNRTMMGQPAPQSVPPEKLDEASADSAAPGRERARAYYPADSGEEDALSVPKKKSGGVAIAVLVIGVFALLGIGTVLAVSFFTSRSSMEATVVQGEDGELLDLAVPGAADGTRVRFHGTEQALRAGHARFPVAADQLSLGENTLSVDVIAPDGTVTTHALELELEFRVRADVGALQRVPPAIDVLVEAPAGSRVSLNGDALRLDARGRGERPFPIDSTEANAEGIVEHVVRYRIQPPDGETEQGELRTRIPLTTMQIDRPGTSVVTDATSIEIAGGVAPGATVTVDGQEVEVVRNRFFTRYPLPELGERTVDVIARAAGRAPHVARIRIRRVADLAAEAAQFQVDEALTYARVATSPTTYRGQRVGFTGVVYNVEMRNGASVLQINVEGCPQGGRCPLWVTYPAATEAQLHSRVRVLGTVAGEQQFRSQTTGQLRTVPSVEATFILNAPAQ
jgi:hypothetical protein